jgi:hypothetical protein
VSLTAAFVPQMRYYFSLLNGRTFDDIDGLEMPNVAAARVEPLGFARDMMLLEPTRRDWSHCIVRVTDEDQNRVFDLAFGEAV